MATATGLSLLTMTALLGGCVLGSERPIKCDALAAPANGAVTTTNNREYPSHATYTCDPGFNLTDGIGLLFGSPIVSCDETGTWSGLPRPLSCAPVRCFDLTAPINGGVTTTNDNLYPSLATYTCNPGFVARGAISRSCELSFAGITEGVWSGVAPACE